VIDRGDEARLSGPSELLAFQLEEDSRQGAGVIERMMLPSRLDPEAVGQIRQCPAAG
jgi:hypothetical protein